MSFAPTGPTFTQWFCLHQPQCTYGRHPPRWHPYNPSCRLFLYCASTRCATTSLIILEMPGGIHAPIEEILKWPTPNYVNPTTRPNTVLLIACICGPFTFAMLMARLWVRIFHQRNPGWDDWLVVAGTVSLVTTPTGIALTTIRFLRLPPLPSFRWVSPATNLPDFG